MAKDTQSPKNSLNKEDLKKWGLNFIKFVAPTLVIFFSLLAQGVGFDKVWPVVVLATYQSLADLFGKFTDGK
ncbi:hypothetical protein HZB78_06390 [Candidatus Collierbacteria bacterium]|nr:hypothetical protein [Candidatus Collierbacteria bacterium]